MAKTRASEWLQIGANVGIIVGLLLVGLQIREANRTADTQFEFEGWTGPMSAHELIIGEDLAAAWTRAAINSHELTDEDLVVINSFLTREWLHNLRMLRVVEAGFDQVDFETSVGKWMSFLGNETALRWWKARQESSFLDSNPKLRDDINRALAERGPAHAFRQKQLIEAMREREAH